MAISGRAHSSLHSRRKMPGPATGGEPVLVEAVIAQVPIEGCDVDALVGIGKAPRPIVLQDRRRKIA